mgnify:CR=1 FL=1
MQVDILQKCTPFCKNLHLQQLGFFVNLRTIAEGGKRPLCYSVFLHKTNGRHHRTQKGSGIIQK